MKKTNWVAYPRYIFRKEIALSLIKTHLPEGSVFLEVGCAAGDIGITLAKNGYKGLMIDFSNEAAEQATSNLTKAGISDVRFEKQDFMGLDDKGKFDLVTMFEVLEHIEKDRDAIEKVRRLLTNKGMFLFSVPAKRELWGASDVIAGHFRRYDKAELTQLIDESGFEIVRLVSYGFPWINIAKYICDKLAAKALVESEPKDRTAFTQKSGLNIEAIRMTHLECLFSKYLLFPFIKISCLFNNMDLAEGYICLARKRRIGEHEVAGTEP